MTNRTMPVCELGGALEPLRVMHALPGIVGRISDAYFQAQRWFGSKGNTISEVRLRDAGLLQTSPKLFLLCLLELRLEGSATEVYFVPLALQSPEATPAPPAHVLLRLRTGSGDFWLVEAFDDEDFRQALLRQMISAAPLPSMRGSYAFANTPVLSSHMAGPARASFPSRRLRAEQSNTSIIYGNAFIMKAFRKLQNGPNPDLEVPLFITTHSGFTNIPLVAGYAEYQGHDGFLASIASLQNFVHNQGDGWRYTLEQLGELFTVIAEADAEATSATTPAARQRRISRLAGPYLHSARHLGELTAGMHQALSADPSNPEFSPAPVTQADVQAWAADMQAFASRVLAELERATPRYTPEVREHIQRVVEKKPVYLSKIRQLSTLAEQHVMKIRHHGDYHLGQVLRTEESFVILDFEGEPARSLSERRAKHCPLRDIAGMLRSFNYAAWTGALEFSTTHNLPPATLEPWAETWEQLTCEAFLNGYLHTCRAGEASFLPASEASVRGLTAVFELDKAIYEVLYELNNRPDWLHVPLRYLLSF